MKNNFPTYLIVLFAIFIQACKRHDLPEQEIPEPDFRAIGTLNGQPFSLDAGSSGLEINSEFGSGDIGQFMVQSSFIDPTCSGCAPRLTVKLNSDQFYSPGQSVDLTNVFQPQTYPLQLQPTSVNVNSVQFFPQAQDPTFVYAWDFGDGNTSSDMNPVHEFAFSGDYLVTLSQFSIAPPCNNVFSKIVHVVNDCSWTFGFDILVTPVGADLYEVSSLLLDPTLTLIDWSVAINNGAPSVYTTFDFDLTIPPDGFADITLNYSDGACIGSSTQRFSGASYANSYCLANFFVAPGALMNTDKYCVIEYTDENGNLYSSQFSGNSGPGNQFGILSSSPYGQNINGHPTESVSSLFSCYLVNINDPLDIIHFENVNAVFAFAHP